jgi:hypothetical protein
MSVITGKPVKAFLYQDHKAHITVHMGMVQDPKLAQLIGQSPMAQQISAAMAAHVQEHLAFEYRKQIEEAAGVPYPDPDKDMPEEIEIEVSRLAAAAAEQVLAKNSAEAAQEKAQETAQDPIVQMQQQELQIKQQEAQIKAQKLMIDATAKSDQIDVELERIASQERIAGMQVGAKIGTDKEKLSSKEQESRLRMGVDLLRDIAQEDKEERQQTAPKEGNK